MIYHLRDSIRPVSIAMCLLTYACRTPISRMDDTSWRTKIETTSGPLFEEPALSTPIRADRIALSLQDARPQTQRRFTVRPPTYTRPGWSQAVELRLNDRHTKRLQAALDARRTGGGPGIIVQVTVLEAKVTWRAHERLESERADAKLHVLVLDEQTQTPIVHGETISFGEQRRHDAQTTTLLSLLEKTLSHALLRFFDQARTARLNSSSPGEKGVLSYPNARSVTTEGSPGYDGRSIRTRWGIGTGVIGPGWGEVKRHLAVQAVHAFQTWSTGSALHLGLEGGLALMPHSGEMDFGALVGPRASTIVPVSRYFHLEPSLSILVGARTLPPGTGQDTKGLSTSVVEDNNNFSSFQPDPVDDLFDDPNGSGGNPTDLKFWGAARLGLGLAVQSHGGGAGVTLQPFAQIGYTHGQGVQVGLGIVLFISTERWADPRPEPFNAFPELVSGTSVQTPTRRQ